MFNLIMRIKTVRQRFEEHLRQILNRSKYLRFLYLYDFNYSEFSFKIRFKILLRKYLIKY